MCIRDSLHTQLPLPVGKGAGVPCQCALHLVRLGLVGEMCIRDRDCPEQHGTLTLLTHDVSGAAVLLVENWDVNKAFGIGFGTFPSDDTGVFHLLEHSVLAGSEKYPFSSPFVQLLKSSMACLLYTSISSTLLSSYTRFGRVRMKCLQLLNTCSIGRPSGANRSR